MHHNLIKTEYLKPLAPVKTNVNASGKPVQQIRCVLFDIYGTLFISGSGDIGVSKKSNAKDDLLERLLSRFGYGFSPAALKERLYREIEKEHMRLKEQGVMHPEVVIEKLWLLVLDIKDEDEAKRFAIEYELITNPVWPMPGMLETINGLKNSAIEIGIISNAQFYTPYLFNWFFNKSLQQFGINIKLTFFSYMKKHAKPSLRMFQLAVKQLDKWSISPGSTLYVGNDMLNDIHPAKSVGFQTALFAGDKRSLRIRREHPLCKNISPDLILTDLKQLLDFF